MKLHYLCTLVIINDQSFVHISLSVSGIFQTIIPNKLSPPEPAGVMRSVGIVIHDVV